MHPAHIGFERGFVDEGRDDAEACDAEGSSTGRDLDRVFEREAFGKIDGERGNEGVCAAGRVDGGDVSSREEAGDIFRAQIAPLMPERDDRHRDAEPEEIVGLIFDIVMLRTERRSRFPVRDKDVGVWDQLFWHELQGCRVHDVFRAAAVADVRGLDCGLQRDLGREQAVARIFK